MQQLFQDIECVLLEERTRALVEQAEVKIYEAHSAAALLAFALGSWREIAAGTNIGFHLGEVTLPFWKIDRDDRRITEKILKNHRDGETLLRQLMERYGLNEPKLYTELYRSGWLYLTADECLRRGLVQGVF